MSFNQLEDFVNDKRDDFDQEIPAGLWDKIQKDLDAPTIKNLETFVQANRAAFDTASPPVFNFESLDNASFRLDRKNKHLILRFNRFSYGVAAAVLALIIGSTLFLGREIGMKAAQNHQLALIESIAPEFTEAESYYQTEINSAYQIVSVSNNDPILKKDLQAIDQAVLELKEELITVPVEERAEVVAKLIESYRIKLDILQNILDKLPPATVEGRVKTLEHESISL